MPQHGDSTGRVLWKRSPNERRMFYKSMTTFADHRVWQDVYHVPARGMVLYVKFQADVITEFVVMSFKEK
ncbi:hypothetical protein CN172_17255 [Sinorhizobium meliloti]|nr:hypothetical protein CN232_33060 [Sinorhizobium meliloti]RVH41848.1 hypothetical protein CN208_20285 [Sinorhizobium meliloti]RVI65205.1 hypothetical protein CN189_12050 [Sinorhizobium meliloti]RVK12901.1 hypothetical protein CN172_17255 [Sinorhizobium meliloti]